MRLDPEQESSAHTPHGGGTDRAFLERVLNGLQDAVFVKNTDGHYVYCNEIATQFISTPMNRIVGSSSQDVFGQGLSNELKQQDRKVLETGTAQTDDFSVHLATGTRIFSVTKAPFRDLHGNVTGLLGTVQNITAQREAERILRQQNAVLEMVATGRPLSNILDYVSEGIENEVPGCSCGILIVDRDRERWRVGSTGRIPSSVMDAIADKASSKWGNPHSNRKQQVSEVHLSDVESWSLQQEIATAGKSIQSMRWLLHAVRRESERLDEVMAEFVVLIEGDEAQLALAERAILRLENLVRIVLENHWNHEELRANETRFRHFVNNTTDAFFMFNDTATVVDVSNRACEYLGFSREELIGRTPALFSPFMDETRFRYVLENLDEGEHISFETIHRRRDGAHIPVDVRLVHFRVDDRVYAMATVRDITLQKRDEAKLRESNQQLASIYDTVGDILFLVAVDEHEVCRLQSINFAFTKATGFSREQSLGRRVDEIVPSSSKLTHKCTEALQSRSPIMWEDTTDFPAAGPVVGEACITPLFDNNGRCTHLVGSIHDITERKLSEAKLAESKSFSQAIIEASPECIKLLDRNGILLEMNASGLRMVEATRSMNVLGRSAFDLIAPEFRDDFIRFHENVCNGTPGALEFEIIGLHGTRRSVETSAVPVDIQGERMHLAVTRDVTARKQVERELRKSTSIIQQLVSGTTDAIFVKDLQGKYLLFNEAASRFVGKPIDSVLGQDDRTLFNTEDANRIMDRDRKIMASGTVSTAEETLLSDGSLRTYLATKGPFFDDSGEVAGIFGISRDITARKTTERELALAQFSVDNVSDSIFWINATGQLMNVNQGACSSLGFEREEFLGKSLFKNFSTDTLDWSLTWCSLQQEGTLQVDTQLQKKDGSLIDVEMRATLIKYEDQQIAFVIASDITTRKEVARSLEMKQFTVDSASDSIFWMSTDGIFIDVNEGACRRLGYKREELIGKRITDIDADYLQTATAARWQSLAKERTLVLETRHRTKHGQLIDVEVRATYLDFSGRSLVCVFASDISARKQTERRITTQYAVTNILSNAASIEDAASGILRAICEGKQWSRGELWFVDSERQVLSLFEAYDRHEFADRVIERNREVREVQFGEGVPGEVWESRRVVFSGSCHSDWVGSANECDQRRHQTHCSVGFPIMFGKECFGVGLFYSCTNREPNSEVLESLGIQIGQFLDRKRTEAKLRLFRTLIDQTSDFIELVDPETYRFIDVNQTACNAHGYSREEYLTRTVFDLVDASSLETYPELFMGELRTKGNIFVERTHIRKDGSTFPVEVNINLIQLEREYMVAVVRDVTERKRMEERLRESQKMDAIGRLAGGLAHDFNNLLTIINCHTELLLLVTPETDSIREHYLAIQHAGSRAAELISQLLAFSRKSLVEPKVIQLNTLIEDAKHLLTGFVREDIVLDITLDRTVGPIRADSGQIEQVLINLVVNARDAMPTGGRLSISTSNFCIDNPNNTDAGNRSHSFVALEVADTGHGIPPEIKGKIFEPFFTTKEVGKGTGLGLSVVHGVVTQCGGTIHVTSTPGAGTIFQLLFPVCSDSEVNIEKPQVALQFTGAETVLVVEDEEELRKVVQTVLEANGYNVLLASSGEEAIRIFRTNAQSIQLLLTDVVMPEMGGKELAQIIHSIRPNVRTLFMSGHTNETIASLGVMEARDAFIHKPFTPSQLLQRVRLQLNEING